MKKGYLVWMKSIVLILLFVIVDQIIKHIISGNFMDTEYVIIPGMFVFDPLKNINLSYLGTLLDVKMPIAVMIVIYVLGIIILAILYRYLGYLWKESKKYLQWFLCFYVSGMICSFVDVFFWGGSIDIFKCLIGLHSI